MSQHDYRVRVSANEQTPLGFFYDWFPLHLFLAAPPEEVDAACEAGQMVCEYSATDATGKETYFVCYRHNGILYLTTQEPPAEDTVDMLATAPASIMVRLDQVEFDWHWVKALQELFSNVRNSRELN